MSPISVKQFYLQPDISEHTPPYPQPVRKAGTRFTYPGRMEGRVDLGALIMPLPGIEPMTAIMCYTDLYFTYLVT